MGKVRHVIPGLSGGWSVRETGASRSTRTFGTQSDAVEFARRVAKKEGGDVFIHRADGTIRQMDSYRADPVPPKSRR